MSHFALSVVVTLAALGVMSLARTAVADEGAGAGQWKAPDLRLPTPTKHPVIAATPEEFARLKAAWAGTGADHDALAERVARADEFLKKPVSYPPEGGQHNQWYQCDKCQTNLETVDAHHHKCPMCGTVYSGFPYDNVLYSRTHWYNVRGADDAAWAYVLTGDKKYAERAAEVLNGYADRYLKYPMVHAGVSDKSIDVAAEKNGKYKSAGHMMEQTLDESMMVIPLATTYDLVAESGVMSAEDRAHVEKDLLRAMAECIDVHHAGKSNWQTWHNAALLYAGAVLGDEAMARQAIYEPKNGFLFQMTASVSPEGMWYENSWGYHYYTLTAMTHIAEGARRLGVDLYGHPLLRGMYTLAFDYQMADGSLPRLGDAVQDSPSRPSVNEEGYAAYHDERILSTLPEKPEWDSVVLGRDTTKKAARPAPQSTVIAGAGHAILATAGPAGLTAAMTFGPYGGFHGHFDKLSFVLFGYGEELGVDPGRKASQAYRLPIHREWYKATIGHNAALVDGAGQKEADGKLLAFVANKEYAAVAADAGPAFESIRHRRLLVLGPTYAIVVDELKPTDDKAHSYELIYHNKGTAVSCEGAAGGGEATLSGDPGMKYLKDAKQFGVESGAKAVTAVFAMDKLTTRMVIGAAAGDEIVTANGPFKSVEDRVPLVIVRRKGAAGETVRMVSVIEPVAADGKATVTGVEGAAAGDGGYAVVVRLADGTKDVLRMPTGVGAEFELTRELANGLTAPGLSSAAE